MARQPQNRTWGTDSASTPGNICAGIEVFAMLWALAVLLLLVWAVGYFVLHVAGALIHLLVLLAVVVALGNLLRGVGTRRAV